MALLFTLDGQAALDLAKSAAPGTPPALDVPTLMAAAFHEAGFSAIAPRLVRALPRPRPLHQHAGKVPVAAPLRPLLGTLQRRGVPVSARALFHALADSPSGRRHLAAQGLSSADLAQALAALPGPDDEPVAGGVPDGGAGMAGERERARGARAAADRPAGRQAPHLARPAAAAPPAGRAWRTSSERRPALAALAPYGRVLTEADVPGHAFVGRDHLIRALVRALSRMGRRNAIIIGFPGTGKSAVVHELARRIVAGDASLPPRLCDTDIFELSPVFLRAGASMVGQYEERVKQLLETLRAHPSVILFVDEIHSLLQSGVHVRTAYTEGNEAFKAALSRRDLTCIGCTTTAEYRHYIEPDRALARRFSTIRVDPPTSAETVAILEARRAAVEQYYAPFDLPSPLVPRIVELTDEWMPGRSQPDKAIQLMDEACAWAVTAQPPRRRLDEEVLQSALEEAIGHPLPAGSRELTEASVHARLVAELVGQDDTLRALARAVVAGLGNWSDRDRPRGVFLFGGPTGVGKTEAALLAAEILGGGRDALIRIDCNTLQGSGIDGNVVAARLIGAPPGYVGYARGQGGVLSRIRDLPHAVVLFDEVEKADPGLGKFLLQVLDEGTTEDNDGNLLDFRRAFVIFTTNAGCVYDAGPPRVGFRQPSPDHQPYVDEEALRQHLAARFGQEFVARLTHLFAFRSLDRVSVRVLIGRLLDRLAGQARARGLALRWEPSLADHLIERWQPRLGVRHLTSILNHRLEEQLSVADAQGDLEGVSAIELRALPVASGAPVELVGLARYQRQGEVLVVELG